MLQPFYILIPESVPPKRIEQSDVNPNICKGILYLILKKQAYKLIAKENIKSITSQNLSVSIHSYDLGKLFGNGYTKALDILHKKILFKYPYSENKSFSFSYNDIHLHKKLIVDKIEPDTTANKGIVKRMREFYNKNLKRKELEKFLYLTKFFDPEKLKIDFEEALKDNEESYTPTTRKKDSFQYGQYIINAVKILDIQNGVYW
ncbi:hypothetical protein ETU08_00585, partial [Apibacter muscae]|uniref:hypothetical protein n=1 Tax=Apibacter muscae TaxID=2509004 RepID=UPI0011ABADB8